MRLAFNGVLSTSTLWERRECGLVVKHRIISTPSLINTNHLALNGSSEETLWQIKHLFQAAEQILSNCGRNWPFHCIYVRNVSVRLEKARSGLEKQLSP